MVQRFSRKLREKKRGQARQKRKRRFARHLDQHE
jgi:hypothetical protein